MGVVAVGVVAVGVVAVVVAVGVVAVGVVRRIGDGGGGDGGGGDRGGRPTCPKTGAAPVSHLDGQILVHRHVDREHRVGRRTDADDRQLPRFARRLDNSAWIVDGIIRALAERR